MGASMEHWHDTIEQARQHAEQDQRPILIILEAPG